MLLLKKTLLVMTDLSKRHEGIVKLPNFRNISNALFDGFDAFSFLFVLFA